jgi:hypothetical protein
MHVHRSREETERFAAAGGLARHRRFCVRDWLSRGKTAPVILAATTTNDDLLGGVNDFFDSGAWMVTRNLAIFFVAVFWLATAYWVYKDARRRIEDPWLVAMATVLGLVPPFVGPIVYLFLRPPSTSRIRERELRSAPWRTGCPSAICTAPCAVPRSRRRSSSARSARRG